MVLLVTGSRYWMDWKTMRESISQLSPDVLIHGNAKGADRMADRIGADLKLLILRYPADWATYGKRAGSIRNQQMLDENPDIDICYAYPGAASVGTWDMVKRAESSGIWVVTFGPYANARPDWSKVTP